MSERERKKKIKKEGGFAMTASLLFLLGRVRASLPALSDGLI